jgi:LmbE family N-acetylglucosaminyl deacetylase
VSAALSLLDRLATASDVDDSVALVVAHQDDETLALGARLSHLRRLTLIHLTDGAPLVMRDAQAAGFGTREAYAAARARELDAALAAAGARPERRLGFDVVDQDCVRALPTIIRRLTADLQGMAAVITHPYEGGHPDHDAAALAVQAACARLGPRAPVRLEFAGYFLGPDGPRTGVFFEDDGLLCAADDADTARKAAALSAYVSQADVLALFRFGPERLRLAPTYDFSQPPANGRSLYDTYGWALTSERWRATAAEALACA